MEEELIGLQEQLTAKAEAAEVQYFTRELGSKLERGELEAFRQDFVDRVGHWEERIGEQQVLLQRFGEELESKVEKELQGSMEQLRRELGSKLPVNEHHQLK